MDLSVHAQRTYGRLLPRLETKFADFAQAHPAAWKTFLGRLETHFPALFETLFPLYGNQYDFYFHLENLFDTLAAAWATRPEPLRALDSHRERHPGWFQSNQMVGGICYVDLFAGNLAGVRARIPYFKELGITYLHLMPLFQAPEGENDGGYAISSYRDVNPALGTTPDLIVLAEELRQNGISLVLDFVFNHTSNEHEWARKAREGNQEFQEYYFMFPDRALPDAYERNLREIFPDEHPGAFTYFSECQRWVWTTFHSYQWDLNYQNPAVFVSMASEMLALANLGVEVLRLDALAFIWKRLGATCESLPEAHQLVRAFNLVTRIASPAMVFKSEAIVHPDEVIQYISPKECQLSYNPLLMALLWEALATREVKVLQQAIGERFKLPENCAWANYVRCHDDIGWTFSDEDVAQLGVNGYTHRQFLNAFYTGRFTGSFARGLPFQENPKTGDCRISGTCASLAGLEKALAEETENEVLLALNRIQLIYGIIMTIGGIPLIYLGDELATRNDYSFSANPDKANDSRWVHRPRFDWERAGRRADPDTLEGKLFQRLAWLVNLRKSESAFSGQKTDIIQTDNPRVLGFVRSTNDERILVFANFCEAQQTISANQLRLYGLGYTFKDLETGSTLPLGNLALEPYQLKFLKVE